MNEHNIRNLAAAITMQAVKDFFDNPNNQTAILNDLRSPWMEWVTNGTSSVVADQLEKNPDEIAERLHKLPKEY